MNPSRKNDKLVTQTMIYMIVCIYAREKTKQTGTARTKLLFLILAIAHELFMINCHQISQTFHQITSCLHLNYARLMYRA